MRNSEAIACLVTAAEAAQDPLDQLACRRAGTWLRWCDGFGATVTRTEAERIAAGGALGEAARGLIRRLAETYPAPPEDARLEYLTDDDETTSGLQSIAQFSAATRRPGREPREGDFVRGAVVKDPFGSVGIRAGGNDLPAPDPWS
ncbi:hypothetical protein [Pseudooceanicola spongiae]|uniref:Uncharacterized protein n=1 Tax=Pseudooceanicola spongiae TaxID=2613965 RepID=A0A7L9WQJ5_9RHOB|nr:hypothetical protein [Pseudooceanicola spongiae]QOL82655.1 hypothetical protein F3W81_18620 [Pseudooceanicola spongiae]